MEFELKHFQFKHPCNTQIVGMTGSGKTILIRRILKHYDLLFHNINKNKIKVLWSYGQWHTLIDLPIDDRVEVIYSEGLPTEQQIEEIKPDIIIIDDLLYEINNSKTFENLFIKKSHHLNISILFSVQNLFYHSKNMRTVSLNTHYFALMKNPRDKNQIQTLAKQIYGSDSKFMIEVYNRSTELPYGYVRVDLTPDTPEILRLQSRITPEEFDNITFCPIVYLPKHVSQHEKMH